MPIGEFKAADLGVEACGGHKVETVKISAPAKRQAGIKIIEKEKEVAVARAMDMLAERKLV
jgi:electron transfer flavoprotein alpha/beta subunit